MRRLVAFLLGVAALPVQASPLFTNGPIITNPTGGTGAIAGLPISQADGFMIPGSTFLFSTTGVGATVLANTSVAENFVVPPGGWDLDSVVLYAFQTSQSTPTVTQVNINLWTAPPFSAGSPPPVPNPLPQPVLPTPLQVVPTSAEFLCHRQSPTGTSTVRPVFAYTVSLEGLPNGGLLAPGAYWLEWSFLGASSPSQNVFTPLVTPRGTAFDLNARLFNSIDGSASGPRIWFEGREGFVAGQSDGRPYALPFILNGTVVPEPTTWWGVGCVVVGALFLRRAGTAVRKPSLIQG